MGTMRREVADIRTRFSVVGLDAVASGFRSVGGALASVTRLIGGTGAGAGAAASAAMSASGQIVAATKDQIRAAEELARAQVKAAREAAQAREKAAADALADAQQEAAAAAQRARNNNRLSKNMLPSQREDALEARRVAREEAKAAQQVVALKAAAYKEELTRSRQSVSAAEAEGKAKVAAARDAAKAQVAAGAEAGRATKREAAERAAADKANAKASRDTAGQRTKDEKSAAAAVGATTREVRGQEGEVRKLAKALGDAGSAGISALGMLKKVAIAAGVIYLGSKAVEAPKKGFDLANRATARAADYTLGQYNTSISTGIPVAGFQVLAEAAKASGIEVQDLRSSLIQLQGQIKAADRDPESDVGKAFAQLGLQTRDENGQLKTTNELLLPIVSALQGLGETDRIGIGSQLFGEDDIGKLMPLFQQLAGAGYGSPDGVGVTNKFLQQRSKRLGELGGFITQADLARAQQYRTAVGDMETAWNGLSREIAAAVGPDVSRTLTAAATDVARYRVQIAAAFRLAFQTFYSLTRDIGVLIFGGRQYDDQVVNRWLLPVRDGLVALGTVAMATGRLVREAYIAIQGGRDAEVREFPWLITLRDAFTRAVAYATTFARDVYNVVTFQDQNVSGQFPWMQTFRNKFVELVDYAKTAWRELGEVWAGTNTAPDTGPAKLLAAGLGELKAFRDYVGEWATWFEGVGVDIATVWEQIGTGNRNFSLNNAGMKGFADSFLFVADAAKEAWGWFKACYDVVFALFRDYLHLNFESVLFFVAIATFTGTLRGLKAIFDLILSPFGKLAGLVTGLSQAGGAATTVATTATALGGLEGALAGIATFATNPLILALLGIGGGVALASALKGSVIDKKIGELTDMLYGVDDSLAQSAAKVRDIQANPSPEQARWRRQRAGMATDDDLAFQSGAASRARAAADQAWQDKAARDATAGDILTQFPGYVPKDFSQQNLTPVVFKIEPAQGLATEVPGYMKRDLVGEAFAAAQRTQALP